MFRTLKRAGLTVVALVVLISLAGRAQAAMPAPAQQDAGLPDELPTPTYVVAPEDDAAGSSTASEPQLTGDALVDEALASALAAETGQAGLRWWLPLLGRDSKLTTQPPTPLPILINGNFDGSGGWVELENGATVDNTGKPVTHIYPNNSYPLAPISLPTAPRLAWLGGKIAPQIPVITHQLIQNVTLPTDYDVSLLFDYYSQSAEPACGVDTAGIYINGFLADSNFPLCAGQSSMTWSERGLSLRALRGQTIAIEFRLSANDSLNSNLYLDNVELCGFHAGLAIASQCQPAGWHEVSGGAARGNGITTGLRNGRAPSLAISGDGRPWAAWQASVGSAPAEIFVKRWNGAAWEAVGGSASGGGISNSSGISARPALAIVPAAASSVGSLFADRPYVAWHDYSQGAGEIYVRRWNGALWEEPAAGSASGGGISNNPGESFDASLAIAPDGTPWVAWTNLPTPGSGSTDSEIYVRYFDGASWVEAGAGSATGGGISNNAGDSDEPSIAIGSDGAVFVAWTDESSGDTEIYLKRWNGSAWIAAGTGSASGGGISANDESSRSASLAVVDASRAFVAWVDRSGGDTEIYAKYWNGAFWTPAGTNGASAGGISNNSGDSLEVSLNIGRNGLPLAAWTDLSGGAGAEIYVRGWNGSAWQPIGASATLGGISGNPGYSSEPSAAVAPDGTPYVVWANAITGGSAVYARRYLTR